MARGVIALVLLALVLFGGNRPPRCEGAAAVQEFIVKFKTGTAGERAALQAMQDQAAQSRVFAEFAATASRELGIPVRIASVTSGRELVVALDTTALTSAVVGSLAKRPDVVRVGVVGTDDVPQVMAPNPTISVEFARGSAIAKSIARAWPEQPAADPQLRALIDAVAGETGTQLLPEAPAILFSLDLADLAQRLGRRLAARADVEYVQPVTMLQPQ